MRPGGMLPAALGFAPLVAAFLDMLRKRLVKIRSKYDVVV
jgi:hypothetical protein